MKPAGLLKIFSPIVFLILFSINASAQNNVLKPNTKQDSIWIQRLITTANAQTANNKDTNRVMYKWLSGKVVYSTDASLKAAQLIANADAFTTTIQYTYQGKIHQQNFDYTDLANYAINNIYRLPDNKPAYLFLLSKTEYQRDYEYDLLTNFNKPYSAVRDSDLKHIQNLSYVAVVLRLAKDSLEEVHFPQPTPNDDDLSDTNTADAPDSVATKNVTAGTDTNSFGFTSYLKQPGKIIKPYLSYDSIKQTLSFLDIGCKLCDGSNDAAQPVSDVKTGLYEYRDTSFVLVKDTAYYYPSLKALDTIVAHRNYKAGVYTIKAKAIEGYEVGYGGYFYPVLTKTYRIGTQTLTAVNNDEWDKIDIKPNYQLQNNGSLILLLSSTTNGHSPGMCGAAFYTESGFWVVDGKQAKELFSFTYGSCDLKVNYTYTHNGKEIIDRFYLISPSEDDNYDYDRSYWKDNSTYVFIASDDEKARARNFYLHFNVTDKKSLVKLTIGKLYKTKRKAAKKAG